MSVPDALLKVEDDTEKCLLCDKKVVKGEKFQTLTNSGWLNLKEKAKCWSEVNIPNSDNYQHFSLVYDSVAEMEDSFGKTHKKCRIVFSNKYEIYKKR